MKKREVRSPIKSLLRMPGQYLEENSKDLLFDRVLPSMYYLILIMMFLVLAWWNIYFSLSKTFVVLVTILLAPIAFWNFYLMTKDLTRMGRNKSGREGEIAVSQQLDELREAGYKIFHDFQTGHGNIDHIVIGPAGVFAIETKAMSKPIGKSFDADYYDKHFEEHKQQAKNSAEWLEQFFADKLGQNIVVQPVLMYPGWYTTVEDSSSDVWVFNPIRFVKHVSKLTSVMDPAEINRISGYIEHQAKSLID